ncbi:MAG: 6-carboxytetrahydropterin synthase QueD [Actinobacteria bacterium]|nr:6-carboxytetrahydropterin synthase QueD [Actinomycetota bacterium]MDI6831323.1 6-carboxytetrahydropterin synthase QueD [Actinomycetota bacterium]
MYEIRAAVGFSAAHFLRGYEGKCARLHGHTWRVRAAVCGSDLGPGEMVIDFHDLEAMLGEAVAPFDHSCLNDLEPFDRLSPTSENIARYLYRVLEERVRAAAPGASLAWVSVSESPDTEVVYREG